MGVDHTCNIIAFLLKLKDCRYKDATKTQFRIISFKISIIKVLFFYPNLLWISTRYTYRMQLEFVNLVVISVTILVAPTEDQAIYNHPASMQYDLTKSKNINNIKVKPEKKKH